MLVEIAEIKARNGSYSALQYLSIIISSSQIQAPNALFLTDCMPAFYNNMKSCFIFFIRYFSIIKIKYFKQITDNKFLPKIIVKLSKKRG